MSIVRMFGRSRWLISPTNVQFLIRGFSCSPTLGKQHNVLIIGGGTAGAAVASRLVHCADVTVVDPAEFHYYQALWTLVGAGICPLKDSMKPMQDILPKSVTLIQDSLERLEPGSSTAHLASGKKLSYDSLVLALGMRLRYDLIPGAMEALDADPRVISNYSLKHIEKTYKAYQAFQGGRAVFTFPAGPIKCAGAPQKVMYLFEDYLRKKGTRQSADIHYFTTLQKMFSVDKYANSLADICRERGITCHLEHNMLNVNSGKSEVTIQNRKTNEPKTVQYDLLHITPPMSVPDVLKATPKLTNPKSTDYVDVDAATLQHKTYPNVWSLGDCSNLPTSKTAAAISSQSSVLCKNLQSVIAGGPPNVAEYDGYTACPLITGYNRGVIAEFGYNLMPLETMPIDQSKERYSHYFLKVHVLPPLYWDWLVKGSWPGPSVLRKLFHFGMKFHPKFITASLNPRQ